MTTLPKINHIALPQATQNLTTAPLGTLGSREVVPISCEAPSHLGKRRRSADDQSTPLKTTRISPSNVPKMDLLSPLPSGVINGKISKYLELSDIRNLAKALGKPHKITNDLPESINTLNELLFHSDPTVACRAALLAIRANNFVRANELLEHLKPSGRKFHDQSFAMMIHELSGLEAFPIDLFQKVIHAYKRYAPEADYPIPFKESIEAAIENCFAKGHFEAAQILLTTFPFRPISLHHEKALNQLVNQDRCDAKMADLFLTYFPITGEQAGEQLIRIIIIEHSQIPSFIKILFKHYGANNDFMGSVLSAISNGSWYAIHTNFPPIIDHLSPEQTETLVNDLPPLCAVPIVKLLVEKGKIRMDGPTSRLIFLQLIRLGNLSFIQKLLSDPETRDFFPNSFRVRAVIEAARNNQRSICALLFRDGLILEPTTTVAILSHLASITSRSDEDGFCIEFLLGKLDDQQLNSFLENAQETAFNETIKSLYKLSRIPLQSAPKILTKAVSYGSKKSVKPVFELMKQKGLLTFENVKQAILEADRKAYWGILELILEYKESNQWPFPYGLSRNSFLRMDGIHSYFEEWWPKVYAVLTALR